MQQVKCSHLYEADLEKEHSSAICSAMDTAVLRRRIQPRAQNNFLLAPASPCAGGGILGEEISVNL